VKVKARTFREWIKIVLVSVCYISVLYSALGFAASSENLGDVAANVTDTFGDMAELITAGSYIAGLAFAVGAILKFKAHKDNPTQIPIGTPIALLFVAAALVFLPSIFSVTGETLFDSAGSTAGVSGITSF
jgi:intracellular multiplication protein IcmD